MGGPSFTGAFQALLLSHNRMGCCVAPLIIRSIHKNGARSVMAPCGFCMLLALAIVALVPCVRSVKNAVTRSNLDE
ncbi:hypothetical protein KSF_011560 [Reticulibacter mediterranei]|uniref:Uncharacterized protein n=1 Tax=Reticulibacter mediterranei TaxID=2778369 RepID=A0A8J3IEM5_9CHLR|nr:hypothetical protein KSF_011560 [Reticulibacter mediterranei]